MGESRNQSSSSPSPKQRAQADYQNIRILMKEIYGEEKDEGYNPLPAGQHHWHLDPDNPPLQRFWGWMVANTIAMGHRTAHATSKREWDEKNQRWKEGRELHVEHFAQDCKDRYGEPMDIANAYRTVRKAIQRGIVRYGTDEEGSRRLYLTGKVPKFASPDKIVCTDNFPGAIQKQINGWSVEDQIKLRQAWDAEIKLQGHVQAALVAANRAVFIQRQDNILRSFNLEPAHQEHKKQEETPADAEARRARIQPILAPIENYVQTIAEFVQKAPEPPRQTASTLLPVQRLSRDKESRSVGNLPRTRTERPQEGQESQAFKQLPTRELSPREREAENLIYSEIKTMQQAFQHMDWRKEIISPKRKSDQLFVYRVIATVGVEYVPQFLRKVREQLKDLDKRAFGKLPGRVTGPRGLGLIWEWAVQYAESLDESARQDAQQKQVWLFRHMETCLELMAAEYISQEDKIDARNFLIQNKAEAIPICQEIIASPTIVNSVKQAAREFLKEATGQEAA